MILNQVFNIDLNPNGIAPAAMVFASQYDEGRPIEARLYMDGSPFALDEAMTVTICERKPSGHVVEMPVTYGAGSNVLLFSLTAQQTAEAGLCLCELKLIGDGQNPIGTRNFYLDVERSPMEAGDPSETWIYSVEEKLAQVEEDYAEIQIIADNIEDIVARAEAAAEAVEAIEPDIESLVSRMGAAEGDIDALETTTAGHTAELSGLSTRMGTAETDIDGLETRMTTAEGTISSQGTRLTAAEGDLSTAQTDISGLKGRMTTAEGNIGTNTSDISGLKARMTTAEGNITTNTGNITTLDGRMTTAEGEIDALQILTAILSGGGAGLHNSIYGGRNLGSSVTAAQKTAISSGSFDDIWLGDYWTINGVEWMVIDINYAPNINKNHLAMMPRWSLYQAAMNTTGTAAGGYPNSAMYSTNMANAISAIEAAFGDMVIEHTEALINATTSGRATGLANFTVKAVLPSTYQTIGSPSMEVMSNASALSNMRESYMRRFNLFNIRPDLVVPTDSGGGRSEMWLRSVSNETYFMILNTAGTAFNLASTSARGVRPYFFIG